MFNVGSKTLFNSVVYSRQESMLRFFGCVVLIERTGICNTHPTSSHITGVSLIHKFNLNVVVFSEKFFFEVIILEFYQCTGCCMC